VYFSYNDKVNNEYLTSVTAAEISWLTDTICPDTINKFLLTVGEVCRKAHKNIEVVNYWTPGPKITPYSYSLFNPNESGKYTKILPAQIVLRAAPANKKLFDKSSVEQEFFTACQVYVPYNTKDSVDISAQESWRTIEEARAFYGQLAKDINAKAKRPWLEGLRSLVINKQNKGVNNAN
jgi:hypothetical protein